MRQIKPAVKAIAIDKRCSVHQMVLAIREGKEGWIQLFGPGRSMFYFSLSQFHGFIFFLHIQLGFTRAYAEGQDKFMPKCEAALLLIQR